MGFPRLCVCLLARGHWQKGPLALLALFGDMVYFLLFAGNAPEPTLWPASILFLYLLVEALALFGPVEVAVIALVAGSSAPSVPGGGCTCWTARWWWRGCWPALAR